MAIISFARQLDKVSLEYFRPHLRWPTWTTYELVCLILWLNSKPRGVAWCYVAVKHKHKCLIICFISDVVYELHGLLEARNLIAHDHIWYMMLVFNTITDNSIKNIWSFLARGIESFIHRILGMIVGSLHCLYRSCTRDHREMLQFQQVSLLEDLTL